MRLKKRAVQSMLGRLGKRGGISGVRCSPHTFRHTLARNYLMYGGDVFSLQRILGHSSLEMVRAYVQLAAGDIAAQHRKFSPVDNMLS
ncbi:tyrosine-type recombinase/integrase [Chloroflexota bacterium]